MQESAKQAVTCATPPDSRKCGSTSWDPVQWKGTLLRV